MGKLKKLVVLGALGAIVTAVAKKLQAGGNESPWQSAPEPATPAAPTPPPAVADERPDPLTDPLPEEPQS
ncbi:hypothetical protein [Pimelobacter simplex]|uniref:hypothetical protein n=1 Tax=Nocardioides simplex TaxID=2045 RepID=UPI0019341EFB|nr:hypothetical protein [Pimelobacter simplex]